MIIGGLNKLTLLDFPSKVACIIFTSGCNCRCPFCQNSPLLLDNTLTIDKEELFKYLKKRKGVLDGVVISGGEPLIHNDIKEFIKEIRDLGYSIKLDTNGTFPLKLKELIDDNLIDYVAMDIKNSDIKYSKTVGLNKFNIDNIKQSINILKNSNIKYEFRTTIVKELHTIDDIKEILRYIGKDELYYIQNFVDSGNILKQGLHGFSKEELENMEGLLKVDYPNVSIR